MSTSPESISTGYPKRNPKLPDRYTPVVNFRRGANETVPIVQIYNDPADFMFDNKPDTAKKGITYNLVPEDAEWKRNDELTDAIVTSKVTNDSLSLYC